MVSGAIFRRELDSAARGGRSHWVRSVAAVAITLGTYASAGEPIRLAWTTTDGVSTPARLALVAERTFTSFADAQLVVVVLLVPLLVAGSVAEERARGTLSLLLGGRLSAAEIVGEKLAARLILALAPMVAGLPMLALVARLGGVEPGRVATSHGGTIAAAWCAGSVALLVSVHSRSAVGAVVGAYAACLAWIGAPVWLFFLVREWGGLAALKQRLGPIAARLARVSPLSTRYPAEIWGPRARTPAAWPGMIAEVSAWEAALGLILVAVAAWRLRPADRRASDRRPGRVRSWLARVAGLRGRPRPGCGDDPIAWKERHAPESAGLARLVVLATLALVVQSAIFHLRHNGVAIRMAMDEAFEFGLDPGEWGRNRGYRNGINNLLCEAATMAYVAALAASAIVAAASVAGERARGTWDALRSTPLDRGAILRAKMWGAAGSARLPLILVAFFFLAGAAITSMHPVGLVLGLVGVPAFVWLGLAVGTYVSVRSKDATRAILRTALILGAVNFGPALILFPFFGMAVGMMFCTPAWILLMVMSRMRFVSILQSAPYQPRLWGFLAMGVGVVVAHAVAARLLTRAAVRRVEDMG